MTMKMISSTNTTSTSGVTLMAEFKLDDSPSRMRYLRHLTALFHLDVRHLDVRQADLRYVEQVVHKLGRRPIHLDVERLDLSGEAVESDNSRDCDENTQ